MSQFKIVTGEERPVFVRFQGGPLGGTSLEVTGSNPPPFVRVKTVSDHEVLIASKGQTNEQIDSNPPYEHKSTDQFDYVYDPGDDPAKVGKYVKFGD